MPPQPIHGSERVRRLIIAALMVGVLLLALGLARLRSVEQALDIGGLQVSVPRGWEKTREFGPDEVFGPLRQYSPPDHEALVLLAGSMDLGPDATLDEAITRAWEFLPHRMPLGGRIERLQVGALLCALYRPPAIARRPPIRLQGLGVLTDGRRYWVVYVAEDVLATTRSELAALAGINYDLLKRVCSSARLLTGPGPRATSPGPPV